MTTANRFKTYRYGWIWLCVLHLLHRNWCSLHHIEYAGERHHVLCIRVYAELRHEIRLRCNIIGVIAGEYCQCRTLRVKRRNHVLCIVYGLHERFGFRAISCSGEVPPPFVTQSGKQVTLLTTYVRYIIDAAQFSFIAKKSTLRIERTEKNNLGVSYAEVHKNAVPPLDEIVVEFDLFTIDGYRFSDHSVSLEMLTHLGEKTDADARSCWQAGEPEAEFHASVRSRLDAVKLHNIVIGVDFIKDGIHTMRMPPDRRSRAKPEYQIKIAKERIAILFDEAMKTTDDHYARRYIRLAKKIGMRYNVRLGERKRLFCPACYTPFKSAKTRVVAGTLVKTCRHCGRVSRFVL